LNIRKNIIGDEGIGLIMKSVARSKTLVHLDISSNAITY